MTKPLDESDYDWPRLLRLQLGEPASFSPNRILSSLQLSLEGRLRLGSSVAAGQLLFACRPWILDSSQSFNSKVESTLRVCPDWESDRFHCLSGDSAAASSTKPSPLLLREDGGDSAEPGRQASETRVRKLSSEAVQRRVTRHACALDALNDDGAAAKVDKVGLWFPAVCLGQACVPNVSCHFYGDLMVCRAARDLPVGSDLVHCRVSSLQSYPIRTEALWDLSLACSCPRCRLEEMCLDRDTTIQLVRRLDAIVDSLASGTSSLAESEEALEELTRKTNKVVQDAVRTAVEMAGAGDAAALDACSRLGCCFGDGKMRPCLFNMLSASFLSIYLVTASLKRSLAHHDQSALWHESCDCLLELVDRCSMLHAHWAVSWAKEVRKAKVDRARVEEVDCRVRETVQGHHGKDNRLLQEFAQCCPDGLDLDAGGARGPATTRSASDSSIWAPTPLHSEANAAAKMIIAHRELNTIQTESTKGPFVWEIWRKGDSFVVMIQVPESLEVDQISLEVSSNQVLASTRGINGGMPLVVELPFAVDQDAAKPARFKKKGRWLSMELPFLM